MLDSFGQLMVVLVVFIGVLLVTWAVTRWISGYQRSSRSGRNIELVDSAPLSEGKYIQIVRLGDKYVAMAVYKAGVTKLAELDVGSLSFDVKQGYRSQSFRSIMDRVKSAPAGEEISADADGDDDKP